jgi:hypothetical protein
LLFGDEAVARRARGSSSLDNGSCQRPIPRMLQERELAKPMLLPFAP